MSKSKGNTVSPDEMIEKYGADSLRLYEMFLGPFEESVAWNDNGLIGTRRFLEKVWSINLVEGNIEDRLLHQTIKKVTKDIEEFKFNTAISSMMILINEWVKTGTSRENFDLFLKLLYPFAPHISQELMKDSDLSWPQFSEFLVEDDVTTIAIQVNGKFRDSVQLAKGLNQQEVENIVLEREKVKKWVSGSIKKVVFIPDKLINILV
jgi:leucyl-tRNA synthetase